MSQAIIHSDGKSQHRQPTRRPVEGGAASPSPLPSGLALNSGRRFATLLFGVALSLMALAFAWQTASGEPLRRMGQHPRGLALGGTGISYSNDEMAFFYNPAGLGAVRHFWVELLPFMVEASDQAVSLAQGGQVGTFDNPGQLIQDNIGKEIQLRGYAFPHAVFNVTRDVSFGVQYFVEMQAELAIHNQATPEIDAFYREDKGQVIAVSFPFRKGQVLAGISARKITRKSGEDTLSAASLAVASANGTLDLETALPMVEGSGTGYDAGMIWRLESLPQFRGQFGAVINNLGGTDLGAAGSIPQEVSVGWTFRPRGLFNAMIALEFRDLTQQLSDDTSIGKRTHFGIEMGLLGIDKSTNLLTLRAGYNGGQPSMGAEIAFWHSFSIQYTLYYQEYGDTAGKDPRKRQILSLNLFGF